MRKSLAELSVGIAAALIWAMLIAPAVSFADSCPRQYHVSIGIGCGSVRRNFARVGRAHGGRSRRADGELSQPTRRRHRTKPSVRERNNSCP
jgi:hypothetical protein